MAKIISFTNQKGGVGKTTSAVNVSAVLGAMGKKVLLVDFDPQGNATSGVGFNKNECEHTVYDAIVGSCAPIDAVFPTKFANLSLMPSNPNLAALEIELVNQENRESFLKTCLSEVLSKKDFDCVIVDCPPSLGLLTLNSLCASDGIVIPMQCEFYAIEGLAQLMQSVSMVKESLNPNLTVTGILITMYNPRYKLSSQILMELKRYYADKLFSTKISRIVSLHEATFVREPVYYYSRYSRGSLEYEDIANEILARISL